MGPIEPFSERPRAFWYCIVGAMTDIATTRTAPDPQRFGSVLASAERLSAAALDDDDTDREFAALLAAAEFELALPSEDPDVTQPAAFDDPVDRAAVSAPWRGGTLDVVAEMAALCGGVVSDELLDPEDRSRVFTRRLARAGQLAGRSFAAGRLVTAENG